MPRSDDGFNPCTRCGSIPTVMVLRKPPQAMVWCGRCDGKPLVRDKRLEGQDAWNRLHPAKEAAHG